MNTTRRLYSGLVVACIAGILGACAGQADTQRSGEQGPGVGPTIWAESSPADTAGSGRVVIAETRDLPTPFAKIVVTDERGRYVVPDLPPASYRVWVRGYGSSIRRKSRPPRGRRKSYCGGRAKRGRRGPTLPGDLLVFHAQGAATSEFPIGKVADQPEWLNVIKSAAATRVTRWHAGNSHDLEGARSVQGFHASVGPAHPVRSGADADGARYRAARRAARARIVRRLDRPDRGGRAAVRDAAAAAGIERNVVLTLWDWSTPPATCTI
jgi:hypothetical protein